MTSLKQHILVEYFNFRCTIQLDLPVFLADSPNPGIFDRDYLTDLI